MKFFVSFNYFRLKRSFYIFKCRGWSNSTLQNFLIFNFCCCSLLQWSEKICAKAGFTLHFWVLFTERLCVEQLGRLYLSYFGLTFKLMPFCMSKNQPTFLLVSGKYYTGEGLASFDKLEKPDWRHLTSLEVCYFL